MLYDDRGGLVGTGRRHDDRVVVNIMLLFYRDVGLSRAQALDLGVGVERRDLIEQPMGRK